MPERATVARAKEGLREGKAPTTAAKDFVQEEIEHVREGKHGAGSAKQAIAMGLSKARRAGYPQLITILSIQAHRCSCL